MSVVAMIMHTGEGVVCSIDGRCTVGGFYSCTFCTCCTACGTAVVILILPSSLILFSVALEWFSLLERAIAFVIILGGALVPTSTVRTSG